MKVRHLAEETYQIVARGVEDPGPNPVPVPGTLMLLAAGLVAILRFRPAA